MASLPNTPTDGKQVSRADKAKELRKRIDDSLDTLAKAVDEVRASEAFKAYLDAQARFHRYSWCNSLVILSQRRVAWANLFARASRGPEDTGKLSLAHGTQLKTCPGHSPPVRNYESRVALTRIRDRWSHVSTG